MTALSGRRAWLPLALALLWLGLTGFLRPLAVPDEGRYVGVAWHMLTSGNWLLPRLDGLPYFHKPPLFYWITAASLALFGHSEWAARVAPMLGAWAGTTACWLFARRWWDERVAKLALVALVAQPLVFVGAQYANLDMLVAGCIATTILACAHAALAHAQGGRLPRAAMATGYLFAALGLLAKGLIGIVLPGMVLVVWLAVTRRPRTLLALMAWWPGWLLLAVVAGPWFLLMQREFAQFAYYFFYVQHFARFSQTGFNNPQPAWFYPLVLLLFAAPASLWALAGLRRQAGAEPLHRQLRWLLWLWVVLVTLFFSQPHSKLVGYIFPVAFPLGLLAADAFARAVPATRWRLLLWRAGTTLGVALGLVALVWASGWSPHSTRTLGEALRVRLMPGDRVVFLEAFYFDVPFYARLRAPVVVVDHWGSPEVARQDNWRKELADAAEFDPERGRQLLVPVADLPRALCGGGVTWVLAADSAPRDYPVLAAGEVIASEDKVRLWRLPGDAPALSDACRGTPSANPAGKS